MRRLIVLMALACPGAFGYASFSGFCEQGGVKVSLQGMTSTNTFQQSYPNAAQSGGGPSVTVYLTGTTTKADIYSDQAGTVKANPFPCSAAGQFLFFAESQMVDLLFAGTGISSFTRSAIPLVEPLGTLSDLTGGTMAVLCPRAVAEGRTLLLFLDHVVTSLTCAANVQAFKGGSITYTGAVVMSGSFDGDQTQHFIPSGGSATLSFTGSVSAILPEWFDAAGSTDSAAAINLAIKAAVTGQTVSLGSYTVGSPVIVPGTSQGITIRSRFFQRWSATNGGNPTPKFNLTAKTGSSPFALLKIYSATVHYEDITVNCNIGIGVNGFLIVTGLSSVFNNILAENCSGDGIRLDPAGGTSTTSSTAISASQVNPTITVASTTLEGQTIGTSTPGNTIALLAYGTSTQEILLVNSVVGTSVTLTGTAQYTHSGTYTVQLTGNTNLMQFYNARSYGSGYVFGSGGTRTCTAGTGLAGTAAGVGWGINQYNSPTNDGNANVWVNFYTSGNACGGLIITEFGNTVMGGGSEGDHGPGLQIGDSAGRDVAPTNGRIGIRNIVGPLGEVEGIGSHTRGVNVACGVQNSITIRSDAEIFNDNACSPLYDAVFGASASVDGTGQFSVINYNSTVVLNPNAGSANGGAIEFWSAPRLQEATISACTNAYPAVCTVPIYYTPNGGKFALSGFTGSWVSANGTFVATKLTPTTFSIPLDSSGFGAVTGTPVLNGAKNGQARMAGGILEITPAILVQGLPSYILDSTAAFGLKVDASSGTGFTVVEPATSGANMTLSALGNGGKGGTNNVSSFPSGCTSINSSGGDCGSGNVLLTNGGTPASAAASCVAGRFTWDASFIYMCVSTDTWKRVAIATW